MLKASDTKTNNTLTCSGNLTESLMVSQKGSQLGTELDMAWAQLISKARSRVGLMEILIPPSLVFCAQRKPLISKG